jgi:hypothetical protein
MHNNSRKTLSQPPNAGLIPILHSKVMVTGSARSVYLIYLPRYTLPHTGLRGEVDIDFSMTAQKAISVLASLQLESFIEDLGLLKLLINMFAIDLVAG